METSSLADPPLFAALRQARSVLIAGAGGGFDVYAGLPLAFALRSAGTEVHLANLSFTPLELLDLGIWLARNVAAVGPQTSGLEDYFPERALARWLDAQGEPSTVYAFPKTGVQPLRNAYRELADRLALDAIVLVDGGTDILMRGDEAGLGTPAEDMTSLAAVASLDTVPTRLVTCLGFGIDAYHGVNHTQVLENIAALDRDGAYLGPVHPVREPRGRPVPRRRRACPGRHPAAPEHCQRPDRRRDEWRVRRRTVHGPHPRQQAVRQPADGRLLQFHGRRPGEALAVPGPAGAHRRYKSGDAPHRGVPVRGDATHSTRIPALTSRRGGATVPGCSWTQPPGA
ncbi:hypothetical protein GCM10010399_76880 [Dactylosporangium fulvum]|uniref:DUF1152 domain-containing protein n=1 Tax=Dactylosporangium fulvum TaxID=53359 RepID=A0ABY5W6E4_9ACTN|nr:DUF1152 domain-containing protein [Dactylosporangium fulvum]UWP84906.1 DUF1152 domain-containing protein [Dactylosporangium fulvum]